VPAMLSFQHGGNWVTRQVQLIGIDQQTHALVSDFGKYLQHPDNRGQLSFALRQDGYDTRDHQAGPGAPERSQMAEAGWAHRRWAARAKAFQQRLQLGEGQSDGAPQTGAEDPAPPVPLPDPFAAEAAGSDPAERDVSTDPFAARAAESNRFDPARQQHTGAILGIGLASYRMLNNPERPDQGYQEGFLVLPGDDVKLTFPTAGTPPKAISDNFTIVDFYESKMSEYDAGFVFVPLKKLQQLRGMIDPSTGVGLVNSIQIKLKPGADGAKVRDKLRAAFSPQLYVVQTWRDKQGPLLAAVQMETAILNVLLFLIIAVAGFGILAIFLMIVVEKTRDIGILKSLGASGRGVMGIFVGYGLSLGLVGSGVGMVLGLLFVKYINEIAALLGRITGRPVFSPEIYYFYEIPTIVRPMTIAWIVFGALTIAVLASILPALRAALLHPVEALRYE